MSLGIYEQEIPRSAFAYVQSDQKFPFRKQKNGYYHYENTPIQIYRKYNLKNGKFSDKNSDNFHISAQNIDCGYSLEPPRRGGSNGYPQSMFLSRHKKNNVYPCKPQFYYIIVGFKRVKIIYACCRDRMDNKGSNDTLRMRRMYLNLRLTWQNDKGIILTVKYNSGSLIVTAVFESVLGERYMPG